MSASSGRRDESRETEWRERLTHVEIHHDPEIQDRSEKSDVAMEVLELRTPIRSSHSVQEESGKVDCCVTEAEEAGDDRRDEIQTSDEQEPLAEDESQEDCSARLIPNSAPWIDRGQRQE